MKKTINYIDSLKNITISERQTLIDIANEYWEKASVLTSDKAKDIYVKERIKQFLNKPK